MTRKNNRQSGHTPGPWFAVGHWIEHPNDAVADIANFDPEAVGQAHLGRSDEEICANVRLAAAAPEMLTTLRAVRSLVGRWRRTGQPPERSEREALSREIRDVLNLATKAGR